MTNNTEQIQNLILAHLQDLDQLIKQPSGAVTQEKLSLLQAQSTCLLALAVTRVY